MDWSKVQLPKPKDTKIQVLKLSNLDYYKLLVICELLPKSQSQVGQTAIYTYLQRTWQEHEQRLIFDAAQEGITPEEMFERLVRKAIGLPPVASDTPNGDD